MSVPSVEARYSRSYKTEVDCPFYRSKRIPGSDSPLQIHPVVKQFRAALLSGSKHGHTLQIYAAIIGPLGNSP
jgi:hypothetical protein